MRKPELTVSMLLSRLFGNTSNEFMQVSGYTELGNLFEQTKIDAPIINALCVRFVREIKTDIVLLY